MTARMLPETATLMRVDRSLVAALIGTFVIRLDGGIVGQLITLYIADIESRGLLIAGATTLGILALAFYAVELIFSPIMGAKADQYGNRLLLLLGPLFGVAAVAVASVAVVGTELGGWSQAVIAGVSALILALAVTRILQGFSAAASIPSILSYLSVRTDGSLALRGRVMATFEVTTAVGLLGGYVIGPQLWKVAGPWGFILTGLIFLSSAACFLVVREDRRGVTHAPASADAADQAREPFTARLVRVLGRRDLLVFVPAWLSVNAIVGLWGLHLVYQMRKDNPNDGQFLTGLFSPDVISGVLGVGGLVFCLGIIIWGSFVLGRLSEITVMRLATPGLFLLCVAAWVVNHSGGQTALLWLGNAGVVAGLAIMSGFLPAAVAYLARLSGRLASDRGLLMGIYSVVLGVGQAVGVGLGGVFASIAGVDGIVLLSFILGVIGSGTVFLLARIDDDGQPADHRLSAGLHA
ncbi:MAG: MFS transporter [Chloroflexi bacterium]|nr:MFS transporter [Chloroflexota bacterium]